MKKLSRLFAVMLCALVSVIGLAACKETEDPKKSEIVGNYYTASLVYTVEGQDPMSFTFADFEGYHEDHTGDRAYVYNILLDYFQKYQVTQDGKVKSSAYYTENYVDYATWTLADGKLVVTPNADMLDDAQTLTSNYENSKIVITVVDSEAHWTAVLTLERIAA